MTKTTSENLFQKIVLPFHVEGKKKKQQEQSRKDKPSLLGNRENRNYKRYKIATKSNEDRRNWVGSHKQKSQDIGTEKH